MPLSASGRRRPVRRAGDDRPPGVAGGTTGGGEPKGREPAPRLRYDAAVEAASASPGRAQRRSPLVSTASPAKFFVNQGVVSSRVDMQNVLRPIVKQTVSYRFMRGR